MARARPEEKRQHILETAKRLFALEGMGISMGEIAVAAEIPVGSIYTYFDSKQALVETIIEEGWNEYREWLEEGIQARRTHSAGRPASETAREILNFFMDEALPRLFSDVHLIMLLLGEAGASAKLREKLDYLTNLVISLVSQCAGPGSAQATADPKLFHTGIMVLLLGALETLALAPLTGIEISTGDIQRFLRQTGENALGISLPGKG